MKIYCIRHGESELNQVPIHQHADVKLSEKGKNQAKAAAQRLNSVQIDTILSSDYARAKETSALLQKVLHKHVEYSPLLREIKKPNEVEGKAYSDSTVQQIHKKIAENAHDPSWHYSDEENFFDFKNRLQTFLHQLEQRTETSLLIVTHEWVIEMLLLLMMFKQNVTFEMYKQITGFFRMHNTGITVCERTQEGEWRLLTWNDHAHISELT